MRRRFKTKGRKYGSDWTAKDVMDNLHRFIFGMNGLKVDWNYRLSDAEKKVK